MQLEGMLKTIQCKLQFNTGIKNILDKCLSTLLEEFQ